MNDRKSPLDQALDLFVYAPIGLALSMAEELPKLVDKGRSQVSSRTAMYRMMGQFAVAEGQQRAGKLAHEAAGWVGDLSDAVSSTWSTAAPADPPFPPDPAAPGPAAAASPTASGATVGTNGTVAGAPSAPAEAVAAVPHPPVPPSGELAIPGYDALSASQVVQRLAGLSAVELESVRVYEAATRGRKTILNRVAQLQSGG